MYSQNHEDDAVLAFFAAHPPKTKTLLEIGAWDPKIFSNSLALIEAGWFALLIEPSPAPMRKLLEHHRDNNQVELIQAAVTISNDRMEKMRMTDDAVSSSDQDHQDLWAASGGYIRDMWVPTITLGQISNQWGAFDLVSFDAEGLSVDLAVEYLRQGSRPQCMIIEHDGRLVELLDELVRAGYGVLASNGENLVVGRV